jgi:hypothetical protein
MKKLELKKELKYLYMPSAKKVEIVHVPRLQFAMIDGAMKQGEEPGTSTSFQETMQALYGIAYTLKFTLKLRKTHAVDYPVMALEGLWWVEDGSFDITVKDNWHYTMMILQPEVVTAEVFEHGIADLRKKRGDSPALSRLRLAHFEEGCCMQVTHIGSYADEHATVERMRCFALENGYADLVFNGAATNEIYMGDPRRADPAKLKTVLRHPVAKAR